MLSFYSGILHEHPRTDGELVRQYSSPAENGSGDGHEEENGDDVISPQMITFRQRRNYSEVSQPFFLSKSPVFSLPSQISASRSVRKSISQFNRFEVME